MGKNILLSISIILSIYFFFLYVMERNSSHLSEVTSTNSISQVESQSIVVNKTKFADLLEKFLKTEPFPADRNILTAHTDHFKNTLDSEILGRRRRFPYSVWVDKNMIDQTFRDTSIDGFRIIPIRYPTSGTAPRGSVYKKDNVNFLIMFTHKSNNDDGHVGDLNLMYDYNNPCPNPNNCP